MAKTALDELVQTVGMLLNTAPDSPAAAAQTRQGLQHCAQIKTTCTANLFSATKEEPLRRYIRFHVASLTHLSNQLDDRAPDLSAAIEDLITNFRQQFYRYMDMDYKITAFHWRQQRNRLLPKLSTRIDPALTAAVITSVQGMIEAADYAGISYKGLDRLLKLQHLCAHATDTATLSRRLYRENLNTPAVARWYQKHSSRQAATELSAIFVDPEKAFEPGLPPLNIVPVSRQPIPTSDRLPLHLSVPQLAVFVRLFYQARCFPVNNVAGIIRFFCRHFSTKRQADISPKSFGRAFYSQDQVPAAIVRDLLQKMLDYLDKTYFP